MRPHLADEISNSKPPKYCAAKNGKISEYVVVIVIFRHLEIKTCKQTHCHEENERVGKCQQESATEICQICVCVACRSLQLPCRVTPEQIKRKCPQDNRTYNLKNQSICIDEIRDERHAITGKQTIYQIAQCCTKARKKSWPTTFVECTLDT